MVHLLLLLMLTGCAGEEKVPELDPATWVFPSEDARTRYAATRDALAARWPDGGHQPLRRGGNFLRERWCADADCSGAQASLAVLHVPPRYPEVFGLVFDADVRDGPLRLVLHASQGGQRITGDAVSLEAHTPDGVLTLGSSLAYTIGEKRFTAEPADLRTLTDSADAFAAGARAQLDALASAVRAHLDSGEAWRCADGGVPATDGGPPPCVPISLTPAEVAAARGALDTWRSQQDALVAAHGAAAHRLLAGLVPDALR